MKKLTFILLLFQFMAFGEIPEKQDHYNGEFCSGSGDIEYLKLIDESFAFLHPNPVVPNLSMLYKPEWDTFSEGAGWNGWWIQNGYGFSYAATPFLQEPWISLLQRSWDLFWDNQGDGKRKGLWGDGTPNKLSELVAPDGCLGDTGAPGKIIYKQGDGDVNMHDWFYEATAAGIVMEAEILLASRDLQSIKHYLPRMERACNSIERTRDPKNNLFLVGPACNLLAPSYGGVKMPDGTFGKGYLAGLSITYLAALDRMVELYKLTGDNEKLTEYRNRQKITRESLSKLLTPAGYFVKSIEPDGTMHGVLGQEHYGYLEGVANADAVALRVADDQTSENIYRQIAAFPEIRPFDFLLTNAPGLDDTYQSWGCTTGPRIKGFWTYGDWVNGGAWGTVEGRAILMYYRLGKFEDIRRSAFRAMKWAKDFRMDAPWSQCGENTKNPWSDTGKFREGGVAVMVDNFAIPAATVRGLFDYEYRACGLVLRPRVPAAINQYTQKQPVRFGMKKLFLSCRNGGPSISSVKVNGKSIKVVSSNEILLNYDDLPMVANIGIVTKGGWPVETKTAEYPSFPALIQPKASESIAELPDTLKRPFAILSVMDKLLSNQPEATYDKEFITVALKSFEDYRVRVTMDAGPGYYRIITHDRKEGIIKFYEKAALSMYKGFVKRMGVYAQSDNVHQRKIAALFVDANKKIDLNN